MTKETVNPGDLLYLYLNDIRDSSHECIVRYEYPTTYDTFQGKIIKVPSNHSSTITVIGTFHSCSYGYIDWEKSTLLNQGIAPALIDTLDI